MATWNCCQLEVNFVVLCNVSVTQIELCLQIVQAEVILVIPVIYWKKVAINLILQSANCP